MEYFIYCDIILEIKDKEIFYLLWYYICYDIIMKIKDNGIFYLLRYYSRDKRQRDILSIVILF